MEQTSSDPRVLYKEISQTLRSKYNPHYNLYQKQSLQEKVQCYLSNAQKPDRYYECVQEVDEKMVKNSQFLQMRFAQIEQNDKDCQEMCAQSFKEDVQKKNKCVLKCLETMKDQCFSLQDSFYESILAKNSEYKKIK